MKYVESFLIKFVLTTIALGIVFGLGYQVSFSEILMISIIISVIAYLADIYILPNVSNFWGTIGDFGLAFVVIWFLSQTIIQENINIADASLLSAFVIAIGEVFYHRYMKSRIIDTKENITLTNDSVNRLQTEFSDEIHQDNENSPNE